MALIFNQCLYFYIEKNSKHCMIINVGITRVFKLSSHVIIILIQKIVNDFLIVYTTYSSI